MKSSEAVSSPSLRTQSAQSGIYTYTEPLTPLVSTVLPKTVNFGHTFRYRVEAAYLEGTRAE